MIVDAIYDTKIRHYDKKEYFLCVFDAIFTLQSFKNINFVRLFRTFMSKQPPFFTRSVFIWSISSAYSHPTISLLQPSSEVLLIRLRYKAVMHSLRVRWVFDKKSNRYRRAYEGTAKEFRRKIERRSKKIERRSKENRKKLRKATERQLKHSQRKAKG